MGELHQRHASAGLGLHLRIIANEEVFLFQGFRRVKYNFAGFQGVSQRASVIGIVFFLCL